MRTTTLRALSLVCVGAVGCTSSGNEDAGAELGAAASALGGKAGSVALLKLERVSHSEGAPAHLTMNAKVARYTGIDGASVLKLLGADDGLHEGQDEGCQVAGRLDDLPMAPEARVELLSIGNISLRAGGLSQELSPRIFPALATTAAGWFYAGNADLPGERPDLGEVAIAAPGEHGVGRFELALAAPSDVLGLDAGGVSLEAAGALSRSRDVELTWEPEDMRDRVELELYAGNKVLSCTARDDGHFVLPQAKLGSLERAAEAQLVARRVRGLVAEMHGVEAAYVRVASSRKLTVRLDG